MPKHRDVGLEVGLGGVLDDVLANRMLEGLGMGLTKYKLGDLIELSDARNNDLAYGISNVKGISIQKKFIETKADMKGVPLQSYFLVKPDSFAYVTVTSRNGEKITLAHNTTSDTYIVSSSYIVFSVKRKELLVSGYLFVYFNRPEFDRYARFHSWGSARETFGWEEMCGVEIRLPSIEVQQKYANIYNAMNEQLKMQIKDICPVLIVCGRKSKGEKIP